MRHWRAGWMALLGAAAAFAAGHSSAVAEAAARAQAAIAKTPPELAAPFRSMAAKALQPEYPDLAKQFPAAAADPQAAPAVRSHMRVTPPPDVAAIQQSIRQMRGLPTDADRAKLATEVAARIRALPPGASKIGLAQSICNRSTEGDLGNEALSAVAGTLAQALRESPADASADGYLQLASLVRYEHVPPPASSAALDAADAILALQWAIAGANDFTLTALDGKTYTLSALRGHVVLLNFWATWCPPCRKEMPDMDKLYRELGSKGLVVLAVSDEPRDKVAPFIEKQTYTFPILLDPGRRVHEAFGVDGIPKSFLFDRHGKLVAGSIDMRTERQFREMLKSAGLE
jgi:peroxiredoxin